MKTKKQVIALLAVLFLGVSFLSADFKLMGGLNLSRYNGDENVNWSYKLGFQGGLGIEVDMTYRTLFEVDVLFFQKGSLLDSVSGQERHVLNSLSIPVLLRSKLSYGTSPYLVGGIEFAGIVSNIKRRGDEEPIDMEGTLKRMDLGVVFGGGFEIELKEQLFLFVEARYQSGLKNLLVETEDASSLKTTSLVVLFGIRS